MEEVVAAITEEHAKEMKTQLQRMEALANAMTELMSGAKAQQTPAANASASGSTEKTHTERAKKRAEYHKKLANATACTHCKKKHPTRSNDKCWELEANEADRPANWKSVKTT
jgi:hypothetical protein